MKVLLVVDLQNDFCPGGALPVAEGDRVVRPVNELMEHGGYDLIVATQDWHPAGHMGFASAHPGKAVYDLVRLQGGEQRLWPDHCVQNTPGAEFHPALRKELIHNIVRKGMDLWVDSYSGFFDNDRKSSTGLHEWLTERAAARGRMRPAEVEIHVCGLAYDYCVKFTALDAAGLGYQTAVLVDACRAVNLCPGDDLKVKEALSAARVKLLDSYRVIQPHRERQMRP